MTRLPVTPGRYPRDDERDNSDCRVERLDRHTSVEPSEIAMLAFVERAESPSEENLVDEMYSPGGPGIALVLEVESTQDAGLALAKFPLLKAGFIYFEFVELHPFAALKPPFARDGRP
jgi:hypothetical protein